MGENEEFNTLAFEKRLTQLKDTQESIQSMSAWCLKQRLHHKKIVSSWLNVLKRVKVEQRLVLFYLANDVIQYSKRKNYEFVESWGLNLQKATPLVRDEKVRSKILRIFKIWEERSVYDDEFLSDLTGLLSAGAIKKTDDDPLDFQPQQLVNKIKQCSVLEADTQLKLKNIHDSHLELSDADALCANLKDRSHTDDVEKELNEGIACVEKYTQALQRETVAREALLALLSSANQYYSTQRGEVKVVAYAYKNFGARVRALKRKLDELIPTLPSAAPSPPQRDEDVPSPGPDEDLDLPAAETGEDVSYNIDRTFNTSISADGSLYNFGLSSFLTSENPMAIFNETADLDISVPDETEPPYIPEAITNTQWNNPAWNVPPPTTIIPPVIANRNIYTEPPASPPPARHPPVPPIVERTQDVTAVDVDHRGILPPPPPPPVLPLLGHIEDVDHRLLPNLPTLPTVTTSALRHTSHQDVDHRNLISLTHQVGPQPVPHPHNPVDQDYRVPPLVPPPDIVESVDMDLSEDEEQQGMYPNQQNTNEHHRRNSFNNNKVLVGGDVKSVKETNHVKVNINNIRDKDGPHTAPAVAPLSNPFDNMPSGLKFNMPFQNVTPAFKKPNFEEKKDISSDSAFEEDVRSHSMDNIRNSPEYEFQKDVDWHGPRFMNHRFPRNWGPRNNFRPFHPQFRPRVVGPRPPNRWPGPRPQRFW